MYVYFQVKSRELRGKNREDLTKMLDEQKTVSSIDVIVRVI